MSRLFKRNVVVTMARPLSAKELATPTTPPNATVVRDLRVSFEIEKNLGSEPNTAEVTIYNLAERTRAAAQRKPLYVRIDAGYDGQAERLFVGDLRWGTSRKVDTTWETVLELGDGERSYRFGRVNRSYRSGVDARTAVIEAARAMGLEPRWSNATQNLLRRQYVGGLSLFGSAHRELSRVLAPFGLTWSIQDGQLEILRTEETRANQAIVISEDTGMVGSPEFGAPENPKKPPTLFLTTLLKPAVTPGGRIQVESLTARGVFKVLRVVHRGDTHGEQWHTLIEARQA